jgi:putative transposase
MRKSRFTDEKMVAILREADRTSVAATTKKHKVSEQTIYGCRKHLGGLQPADVKRLKSLEAENAKLKKLQLAERDLDVNLLKEISQAQRIEQVDHVGALLVDDANDLVVGEPRLFEQRGQAVRRR